MPMNKELRKALEKTSDELHTLMDELLPKAENGEARVIEAMRYSVLSGGKRLRPFLTVTCANLFGVGREPALLAAAAIEFVHTYSLIHDDLPAMDDDEMRRGQPSCHIMFDEGTAILAGDGLLTFAFEILTQEDVHYDPKVRLELVQALAMAAGCRGMVGGQMMDLQAENQKLSLDEVIRLQRLKTGKLFAVACESAAILGKVDAKRRHAIVRYAHDLGLSFQMTDDLLDAEGMPDEMGKPTRQDKAAGKATIVSAIGLNRAREQAQILAEQAQNHLMIFDKRADPLRQLAQYVVDRKN